MKNISARQGQLAHRSGCRSHGAGPKKDAETLMARSDFGEAPSDLRFRSVSPRLNRCASTGPADPISIKPSAAPPSRLAGYIDKNIHEAGPNHLGETGFGQIPPSLSGKDRGLGIGHVGRPATVRPCHGRGRYAASACIDPSNGDHVEEMILLYRVVGPPLKAARAFRKTLAARSSRWRQWPNGI